MKVLKVTLAAASLSLMMVACGETTVTNNADATADSLLNALDDVLNDTTMIDTDTTASDIDMDQPMDSTTADAVEVTEADQE